MAVSKLPWLTALHAFGTCGTWTRGYYFTEAEYSEHPEDTKLPIPYGLRSISVVQFANERRRGWEEAADSPQRDPRDAWDQHRNVRIQKRQPGGDRLLCVESLGWAGGEFGVDQAVEGLRVGYWLEVDGEIQLLNDLQWADWDREGYLLVATRSGKLQVWDLDGDRSEALFEEDLSLSEPNPAHQPGPSDGKPGTRPTSAFSEPESAGLSSQLAERYSCLPAAEAPRYVQEKEIFMKGRIMFSLSLILVVAMGANWSEAAQRANSNPDISLRLIPDSTKFDLEKVPYGTVGFTASIKNKGTKTIKVAHPTVCYPADPWPADNKQGSIRHFSDHHGKSEILLKITRPNGENVVLRDGHYFFDPGFVPLLKIPPNGTGTFHVGWFFQNARGRWERDDEAAKVFLLNGKYKVRILLRNVFPKARWNENNGLSPLVDVWTGEIESPEITIEVQ